MGTTRPHSHHTPTTGRHSTAPPSPPPVSFNSISAQFLFNISSVQVAFGPRCCWVVLAGPLLSHLAVEPTHTPTHITHIKPTHTHSPTLTHPHPPPTPTTHTHPPATGLPSAVSSSRAMLVGHTPVRYHSLEGRREGGCIHRAVECGAGGCRGRSHGCRHSNRGAHAMRGAGVGASSMAMVTGVLCAHCTRGVGARTHANTHRRTQAHAHTWESAQLVRGMLYAECLRCDACSAIRPA